MQRSMGTTPTRILEWLQEMGYTNVLPSSELLRLICRGNMVVFWDFLLARARSDRTAATVRKNILVHGWNKQAGGDNEGESKIEIRERNLLEEETSRLREVVRRKRKDLKTMMVEVAKEETERGRALHDRSSRRQKQVMLEAYNQQCDEAAKIFAEYRNRIRYYVNEARNAQRSSEAVKNINTIIGKKSSDDVMMNETAQGRNIRNACETLASCMIEKIRNTFPAFEGIGIHSNPQPYVNELVDLNDESHEIPDNVKAIIVEALRNPMLLLQELSTYNLRINTLIHRETEKLSEKEDAELLRYKYENNEVTYASTDVRSPLKYQIYEEMNVNGESHLSTKGSTNQLLERQKAHVQQFIETEDALNKASYAKSLNKQLIKRLEESLALVTKQKVHGGLSQTICNIRQYELEVLEKERESAGLKASLKTLASNVERLENLCVEWKEAEETLRKKWKIIEEFDARRLELETIYTTFIQANLGASIFWGQQLSATQENASKTIVPACSIIMDISYRAKDLIKKELSAFYQIIDNSHYMLPSMPEALLEYMGSDGSTESEAIAISERNANLLVTRAACGDPSAIPSICHILVSLQYPTSENSRPALANVLESLDFCLKLQGSEAAILEQLSKAINLDDVRNKIVENNRLLINHASCVQHEYESTVKYCLKLSLEQERVVKEKWLPELRNAILNTEDGIKLCKVIQSLVDEWWEQPAATVVDWVTVDEQNVITWLNRIKQIHMALYDQQLLSTS